MGNGCVSDCPTEKGFEFRIEGGQARCVYKASPSHGVNLMPNQVIFRDPSKPMPPPPTLESLQTSNPPLYALYKAEQERVTQEIAIIDEKIGKGKRIKDAFARLQDAENARDNAPDAYQQARILYYTLVKGDSWVEEEKKRIARVEVYPAIAQYRASEQKATKDFDAQRKTVDIVNGLKDKVLSLKDDVQYASTTLKQQVEKVKNQINMERRGREKETTVSFWSWLDTLLNVVIVGALLYALMVIYPKAMKYMYPRPAPGITIGQPAVRV
jgi:hypothetical protein